MTGSRHLQIVTPAREAQPQVRFCGHCGEPPAAEDVASRVCERCGLGLLLQADADAAPGHGEAFLVVDSSLTVCAVSQHAEHVLGVLEPDAVDRRVTEFLVPADVEGPGPEMLINEILNLGAGGGEPLRVVLRPTGDFGVRIFARLAACGPPRAALVILGDE